MIRISAASAAAVLLASTFASPVYAYCDEDCAYERQEAAYERAYGEDDEGYGRHSGGGQQRYSRRSARNTAPPAREEPTASKQSKSGTRTAKESDTSDEPKTSKRTQLGDRSGPVKNENSSIVEGSTQLAEDDTASVPRKSKKALGCRTYLPSVGKTVSVPCD